MKTNQVLVRQMGEFEIQQRTQDSMFNATMLLKQWNAKSGQQKQMAHFLENNSTQEFIQAIENQEISKQRNSVLLKSRGKAGGTWMHPYLFIDFAMWLNPKFKYNVIQFVYDQLIQIRHEAGDNYKVMSSAVASLVPHADVQNTIIHVAKSLNNIVYGQHFNGIRNKRADASSLSEMNRIQTEIARLVELGFITNINQLGHYLRLEYQKRWGRVQLS